jgi:hypothetical protein
MKQKERKKTQIDYRDSFGQLPWVRLGMGLPSSVRLATMPKLSKPWDFVSLIRSP